MDLSWAEIFELLSNYWGQIVAAIIGVFALWFRDRIIKYVRLLWDAVALLFRIRKAIRSESPWLVKDARKPEKLGNSRIPILAIANLKGGVGKTTIAANLAGYFCSEARSRKQPAQNCRVLLVDLDFQGSLSSMVLNSDDRIPARNSLSKASKLVTGALTPEVVAEAIRGKESDAIQIIPAYYDLARIEQRALMEWLVEDFKGDLRYILRELLFSEAVQSRYDVVIIDCPPRLSTALIQALCASTHLLIPTKLDRMSGEAVGTFVDQVENLRNLMPGLKIIGAVGAMVSEDPENNNPLPEAESIGEMRVNVSVRAVYEDRKMFAPERFMLPRNTYIADRAAIARHSGERITFLNLAHNQEDEKLRKMIRRLGKFVEEKIHEGL